MTIDLVYLWVDGSDEQWLAKKNAALAKITGELAASSATANRWADHDELKYSLRSVEKFVPWINHIFIVTDGQTPKWLNTTNPKITIVDHKEIIPEKYLPTFNSSCIELFLHKIPNLSEHFLYSNDDSFFGKPLLPSFFFDENGNPIVQIKERNQRNKFKKPSDKAVKNRLWQRFMHNTLFFVYQKTGKKYNVTNPHAIEPMRKSYFEEIYETYEDEFLATSATTFRGNDNIQRMAFRLIDNAKGRNTLILNWQANEKPIVYTTENDSFFTRLRHDFLWFRATIFGSVKYNCYDKEFNLIRNIKKYKPNLFTINDFSAKKSTFDKAVDFMNEMFPNKSEFEK